MPVLQSLLSFHGAGSCSPQDLETALLQEGFLPLGRDELLLPATVIQGSVSGCFVLALTSKDMRVRVTFQLCEGGFATLDLVEQVHEVWPPKPAIFSQQIIDNIEKSVKTFLQHTSSLSQPSHAPSGGHDQENGVTVSRLPCLKRGFKVDPYICTTDNRVIEYDVIRTVCKFHSQFQKIEIWETAQYGNMLLLDNDVNIAESDFAYTSAITGNGREDFCGKTVLILGGGDGGILHELLKTYVKHVTMIEIDEQVLDCARKHLRGICRDSLDSLKGNNYEVLVQDCVPVLEEYVSRGKEFDFVINDLTAIPISTKPVGSQWDFLRLILDLSLKVLAPSGKYYTQGNGYNSTAALAMYEEQIGRLQLQRPVGFSKETVCVPSYLEQWVFYCIWKASSASS